MTDANSLSSLRCPNCGAPLDVQPGQTSIRCRFCDSVIDRSADAMTADDHARRVSPSQPSGGAAGTQPRRYIMKMQNGVPVMIEAGSQTGPAPMMGAAPPSWSGGFGSAPVVNMPVISSSTSPGRSSSLSCIIAIIITLLVMCGIGAAFAATTPAIGILVGEVMSGNIQQALGNAGSLGARVLVGQSGIVVNGANDGPPEAILLTAQYPATSDQRENRIVDLNIGSRKLLWQTTPLDAKLYTTPILADSSRVYFLNGKQLLAINRTDGSAAWQATLADQVQLNLCPNCLQLAGAHLVALSTDGTLESLDAATGKSQWNVRSQQDSPRGLYLLGQRAAFMDRNSQTQGVLRAFDLASGQETSVTPECKASGLDYTAHADWITPLIVAPKGTDFYLFFGTSPVCAQRWDAQTLKMVWSTVVPDNVGAALDSPQAVFSDNNVYIAQGSYALSFAIQDGTLGTPITDPDYQFNVLATHGDDVILTATRQRGTARDEIWAVNGTTGQVHWKFPLDGDRAMQLGDIIDDNTPQWTAQPSADGLRVLRFQSAADNKSYAILQDVLAWDSGQSAGQQRTPLSLDTIILNAPDWMIWKNNVAWMVMNEELLSFDAGQNKITYQWP